MTFETIEQIIEANKAAGQHFFDADTMRFFRSRIGRTVYGGRFFITSEQFEASDGSRAPRMYTVRRMDDDGSIGSPSGFQRFATSAQAKRWIAETIRGTDEALSARSEALEGLGLDA